MNRRKHSNIQEFVINEWLMPLTDTVKKTAPFIFSSLIVAAVVVALYKLIELSPTSSQIGQTESEILATQIEFILKMNSAFLGFLGIIGALLTWFFKNSLEDAKKVAQEIARQELATHLRSLVKEEIQDLDRSLLVERVVRQTSICYYTVSEEDEVFPEHELLKQRGFVNIHRWNESRKEKTPFEKVLIIDFVNSEVLQIPNLFDEDRDKREKANRKRECIFKEKIGGILQSRPGNPICVVYIRPGSGRIAAIDTLTNDFPKLEYYTSANTPVALMGAVVDAAYVTDSLYRT
jgi:hypothetical protein